MEAEIFGRLLLLIRRTDPSVVVLYWCLKIFSYNSLLLNQKSKLLAVTLPNIVVCKRNQRTVFTNNKVILWTQKYLGVFRLG